MEKIKGSPFKLDQVTFQKFFIERQPKEQGKCEIEIVPSGYIDRGENTFLLVLDVNISDTNESYKIDMTVFGHFEYKDVENKESLDSYFYTNAPALVFPYVRTYVTAVTALSGLDPVNLPLMNLSNLKNTLKKNITDLGENKDLVN